jgi:hypothetical protein
MKSKVVAVAVLIAIALIGASLVVAPYKDERRFNESYMAMSSGDSERYWTLRDQMLTPKYPLQDYGITLLALAMVFQLVTRTGNFEMSSPKRTSTVVAVAVALPVVSTASYVFDLFQGLTRGEFPHWADSLAIPLMGAPVLFVCSLVWSLLHLFFLVGGYTKSNLRNAISKKTNLYLLLLSGVTALLVGSAVALGQYWYAIPGGLWLYYYLSLAAGRRRASGQATHDT